MTEQPDNATLETAVETVPSGQGHFQMFAADGKSALRWRLLSANNRELGRAWSYQPDTETCLLAIKQMLEQLDGLLLQTRRREGNVWQWMLCADESPIAISGHTYDRQVRAIEAAARFRAHAATARIGANVMLTGTRRWMHAASDRQPLRLGSAAERGRLAPPAIGA